MITAEQALIIARRELKNYKNEMTKEEEKDWLERCKSQGRFYTLSEVKRKTIKKHGFKQKMK